LIFLTFGIVFIEINLACWRQAKFIRLDHVWTYIKKKFKIFDKYVINNEIPYAGRSERERITRVEIYKGKCSVAMKPECVKFSRKKIAETCYQIAWIVSIVTHNSIS
jgi:hypothetical protein